MTSEEYKAIRLQLGLTQVELAEKLGVRGNTIARRERGLRVISKESSFALLYIKDTLLIPDSIPND